MKKNLIIVFLLLSYMWGAAQSNYIGTEVGLGLNSIFGNPGVEKYYERKSLLGFNSGIQLRVKLYKNFGLKSGLYYERKGNKEAIDNIYSTYNARDVSSTFEYQLDYISIPVLVSYQVKLSPRMGVFISAGSYLSYLKAALLIIPNYKDLGLPTGFYPYNSYFKKIDYGFMGDAQFYAQLNSKIQVTLAGKFAYGNRDISSYQVIENGSLRNKSFIAQLGINYTWNRIKN